ncbi:aldo/keto reductase [Rhodobium gokarnense]|uniref:Aryl-alcohol dehydrogenase-like predicted oxidoreductase n=1 Tax=Rhodobium gokarnense TaxID=364296 RepID=A0ABT3HAY4_9HYPH|nr:aldo/keto reductase [Rhodobium gokarnense]MCW2307519.1 aryl-alcohol dehydrogenase-like predicted oxidoreductase [Rhodobium gokarnense]
MQQRKLGPFDSSAVAVGCMNLSHAYGTPPGEEAGSELLLKALDRGYTLFDTAALYGFGANEKLVGRTLSARRDEFLLASKCGMDRNDEGKREINGRPEVMRRTVENSLRNLNTDVLDLCYLHRWDKRVPIEESIGALADMVQEGKLRTIGLSEVSAATVKKAHAVHPVTAVQSEYSLWTRNPEIGVIEACAEIGAAFVAFSPLARKFLTGTLRDVAVLEDKDLRKGMPRFQPDTYAKNLALLDGFAEIARDTGCSMAELALAWVLAKADHIIALPGTTSLDHLAENAGAAEIALTPETIARCEALINEKTVHGPRYPAGTQQEIDTEEFAESEL